MLFTQYIMVVFCWVSCVQWTVKFQCSCGIYLHYFSITPAGFAKFCSNHQRCFDTTYVAPLKMQSCIVFQFMGISNQIGFCFLKIHSIRMCLSGDERGCHKSETIELRVYRQWRLSRLTRDSPTRNSDGVFEKAPRAVRRQCAETTGWPSWRRSHTAEVPVAQTDLGNTKDQDCNKTTQDWSHKHQDLKPRRRRSGATQPVMRCSELTNEQQSNTLSL